MEDGNLPDIGMLSSSQPVILSSEEKLPGCRML